MFILLAIIAGVVAGASIHLLVAGRDNRGVLVSGAIGAAVAAVVYTAFTWAGVGEASVWTWLASIGAAILISLGATVLLTRTRIAHDEREAVRLGVR